MKKIVYPGLVGEMASRGETQAMLGKVIGVSHVAICRRLSGKQDWSISEIDKICEHYNKNYYELFKKEGK